MIATTYNNGFEFSEVNSGNWTLELTFQRKEVNETTQSIDCQVIDFVSKEALFEFQLNSLITRTTQPEQLHHHSIDLSHLDKRHC